MVGGQACGSAMLAIDLLLLAGGAALLVLAAGVIGARLGPRLERRRRRRAGARNAAAEAVRQDEVCAACGDAVDPAHDLWDGSRWWHRRCHRELVREEP